MIKAKKDINLNFSCKSEEKKDYGGRSEKKLHDSALAVEKDKDLKKEMREWDVTFKDGLNEKNTNLLRNKDVSLRNIIMSAYNNFSKKYKNALKKLAG